jgi:hypothetical protein
MTKLRRYRHDEIAVVEKAGPENLLDRLVRLDVTVFAYAGVVGFAELVLRCRSPAPCNFARMVDSAADWTVGEDVAETEPALEVGVTSAARLGHPLAI